MAILWIDGFEGYGTATGSPPSPTGVVARKYSNVTGESSMDIETGRFGGYCLEIVGNASYIRPGTLTTDDTLTLGVAVKFTALGNKRIIGFYDGGTLGMNVELTVSGELEIYRGITLLDSTSGLGLVIDTWYYIEFQVKCHDSTGEYELRVGQVNVASATGVDTKAGSNNYHTTFDIGITITPSMYVDDLYCLDSTGSDGNDFLGNCKVIRIDPDGDDTANWTTSTPSANHYENVDEAVIDDDTSYVEESTTNVTDLYDYESVPSLGTIYGLQVNTECRETDATTYSIITPIESGGNQYDDSAQSVSSGTFTTRMRVAGTDPDTGNLWTESGINAAKFGIKVG
jgi:hypothetical protein